MSMSFTAIGGYHFPPSIHNPSTNKVDSYKFNDEEQKKLDSCIDYLLRHRTGSFLFYTEEYYDNPVFSEEFVNAVQAQMIRKGYNVAKIEHTVEEADTITYGSGAPGIKKGYSLHVDCSWDSE